MYSSETISRMFLISVSLHFWTVFVIVLMICSFFSWWFVILCRNVSLSSSLFWISRHVSLRFIVISFSSVLVGRPSS